MFSAIAFKKDLRSEQLQLSRLPKTDLHQKQTFSSLFVNLKRQKTNLRQDFLSYILWYFDLNVYPEARFATEADLEKVGRRRSLTSVMPAWKAGSKEAMVVSF